MSYSAYFQLKGLPNCQMSKFEVRKIGVTSGPLESDLLDKICLENKMSILFSNLKLWNFVALQAFGLQEHTLPHLKDLHFFLLETILKKCAAVLFKVIHVAESNPVLLH